MRSVERARMLAPTFRQPREARAAPPEDAHAQGMQNSAWVIVPTLLFILILFVWPMVRMFQLSVFDPGWTLHHYAEFVRTPAYVQVLRDTIVVAFNVSLICLVLAYPVAYAISSMSPRNRRLLLVPVMLPYLTSLMVRTFAWMVVLGHEGVVNQFLSLFDVSPLKLMNNSLGVYIGMVHYLLPLMILPLYNTMCNIDARLVRAAEGLGATRLQAFVRVFLPLSVPGVAAGMSLVFIIALGFFVTPALLGGLKNMMISMLIENQVGVVLDWGFASALAVILLLTTAAIIAVVALALKLARRALAARGVRLSGIPP